jgi:putative DNA primase/helicase
MSLDDKRDKFFNGIPTNAETHSPATFATYESEPLHAPLPTAETYPAEALDDVLGKAAQAIHETVKAPLALCCQAVLASASLAAQAHFDVVLPWASEKAIILVFIIGC